MIEQAYLLLIGSQYRAEPAKSMPGRFNIRHNNSGALVYALLTPPELLRRAREISNALNPKVR